jgi:DNA-binding transcriptional LysR family regulator
MWETIELREIRVFLALAQELHFRRAAERLGVTQSRVSQSLRGLELKLGESLVHRTSRRVELTAAGESFLAEIGPAYEHLAGVLEQTARNAGEIEGVLRIGLLTGVSGGPRLIEAIKRFEERNPRCSVEVTEVSLSSRLEALRDSSIDVVVTRLPLHQPDLVVGPVLSREPRVLGVAADHALSDRDEVALEDIADHHVTDVSGMLPPELRDDFLPRRAPSGRPMKFRRLEHHDLSELVTAIAMGRIVHPTAPSFADHFAHPGIRYVPIGDMPAWETALAWRRSDSGPRLKAFVASAEAVLTS